MIIYIVADRAPEVGADILVSGMGYGANDSIRWFVGLLYE